MVISAKTVRLLVNCAAGIALALAVGCNEESNRPSTTMPVSRYQSEGMRKVPEYLQATIYERADMWETSPYAISGYGLIAGLRGTGDNSAIPQLVREYMVKEIQRGGFGSYNRGLQDLKPETILRDPRFAVVRVDGLIPPGAREQSRFDVYVSALDESYTKSLSHGVLYTTDLRIMGANPRNPSGSVNNYAVAAGPVFVNPAYALLSGESLDAAAQASLRYGVVMDGAVCLIDNPLLLRIRDPQFSTSRAIERRINERFQNIADKTNAVGRLAMAAAQDDAMVKVYVPRSYHGDWEHFAGVVKHLYLKGEPGYLAQMAQKLADAAQQADAPLENISFALEGIGLPAQAVLSNMMKDPKPEVVFAAARAAAFTSEDQAEPRNVLMAMAKTSNHPFRINAVRTLAAMLASKDDAETRQAVRQLINSDNNYVRIEAYKALARNHDSVVFTPTVNPTVQEKFALDILPSSGAPMVYATRRGLPRIAIFGMRQSIVTPVTYSALDSRLTLTADKADAPITIFYRSEAISGDRSTGVIQQQSRADLANILARLGGEAAEDEKRLDFSYSDVVALLQSMHQAGKLVGKTMDGTEVPITLVIEEDTGPTRDEILSAPQIPEVERLQGQGEESLAPRIPDTASPVTRPTTPAVEPTRKGRAN